MRFHFLSAAFGRSLAVAAVAAFGCWSPCASQAQTYQIDDGTAERGVGLQTTPPGGRTDLIALNSFATLPAASTIRSISIAFGSPNGTPSPSLIGYTFTAVLWSDPNNDGSPTDAQVLTTAQGKITSVDSNTFITLNIAPTQVLTNNFFVGFLISNILDAGSPGGVFPAALDQTLPTFAGRSFLAGDDAGMGNIYNLSGNQLAVAPIETFGGGTNPGAGNWLIRANTFSVPDGGVATGALLGLSLAGLALLHRRFGGRLAAGVAAA